MVHLSHPGFKFTPTEIWNCVVDSDITIDDKVRQVETENWIPIKDSSLMAHDSKYASGSARRETTRSF